MSKFDQVKALPAYLRTPVLEALDAITAPLSARELDRAVMDAGFTRGEARRVTKALKQLKIIALTRAW